MKVLFVTFIFCILLTTQVKLLARKYTRGYKDTRASF
ncbi:hypothetical protein Ga0451573_000095 [Peptococcaceae bacterium DYL19]|nr:hypothetical protein [Phosphitispora fastidiosa]